VVVFSSHMASNAGDLTTPQGPLCAFCKQPVEMQTAKTDEHGNAVHEHCYFLKLLGAKPPSAEEVK
jgi:hypothetical protein